MNIQALTGNGGGNYIIETAAALMSPQNLQHHSRKFVTQFWTVNKAWYEVSNARKYISCHYYYYYYYCQKYWTVLVITIFAMVYGEGDKYQLISSCCHCKRQTVFWDKYENQSWIYLLQCSLCLFWQMLWCILHDALWELISNASLWVSVTGVRAYRVCMQFLTACTLCPPPHSSHAQ